MDRSTHTVTIPVKDYEELINNQLNPNLKKLTGGPIYDITIRAIKEHYHVTDINSEKIELYFVVE